MPYLLASRLTGIGGFEFDDLIAVSCGNVKMLSNLFFHALDDNRDLEFRKA